MPEMIQQPLEGICLLKKIDWVGQFGRTCRRKHAREDAGKVWAELRLGYWVYEWRLLPAVEIVPTERPDSDVTGSDEQQARDKIICNRPGMRLQSVHFHDQRLDPQSAYRDESPHRADEE